MAFRHAPHGKIAGALGNLSGVCWLTKGHAVGDHCRRRYHRFPAEQTVWWERNGFELAVTVLNVSVGGMLCRFSETPADGERITLLIQFRGAEELVSCRCRVVHSEPCDGEYQVGLQILEMEGTDPVEITQRIAAQLVSQ